MSGPNMCTCKEAESSRARQPCTATKHTVCFFAGAHVLRDAFLAIALIHAVPPSPCDNRSFVCQGTKQEFGDCQSLFICLSPVLIIKQVCLDSLSKQISRLSIRVSV